MGQLGAKIKVKNDEIRDILDGQDVVSFNCLLTQRLLSSKQRAVWLETDSGKHRVKTMSKAKHILQFLKHTDYE